jgi:hypothetical protein
MASTSRRVLLGSFLFSGPSLVLNENACDLLGPLAIGLESEPNGKLVQIALDFIGSGVLLHEAKYPRKVRVVFIPRQRHSRHPDGVPQIVENLIDSSIQLGVWT